MKTIKIKKFGLDGLAFEQDEKPVPTGNQVLIRTKAVSLNYLDLFVIKGLYNSGLYLPHIPGSDASGEIEAVGPNVTKFKVGDHVISTFHQTWQTGELPKDFQRHKLGCVRPGVLSEFIISSENSVVPAPDYLTYQEASTLPVAALTAWVGLVKHGKVIPGQTVLLQGAGGVSVFGLQFAKKMGLKVISISGSDHKLKKLKEMGSDELINYNKFADWHLIAKNDITNGNGVDIILDVAGEATLNKSIYATRPEGFIGVVGVTSGISAKIDLLTAIDNSITLKGFSVGSHEDFLKMNNALSDFKFQPVIDKVFPITEFIEAFKYLENGDHIGKIVIDFTV